MRSSNEIIMGIDVGSSAVKTVIAEKREGEALPYVVGMGISPSHGLRKGFIVDPEEVSAAIKTSVRKAQGEMDIKTKRAFVSMGGIGVDGIRSKGSVIASRADREITENDIKRSIKQCETQLNRNSSSYLLNRDILHTFPLSFKIDGELCIGNPSGMKGEKLEAETLFVTTPSQHLNNLIKSVEAAGITIDDIVADSYATSRSLLNKRDKEVGCMLLNIGGDTSSLMVFEEGSPVSLEIFSIGSNHITYDVAQGFQILLDEAEQLKTSYGSDSSVKRKLHTIVEPRLNDIFELVENHLNKIKRNKLLPAGIILTGGGSNLLGIDDMAKSSLQIPAQLTTSNFSGDPKEILSDPIWSVALGLCLTGMDDKVSNPDSRGLGSKTKKTLMRLFKNFLP